MFILSKKQNLVLFFLISITISAKADVVRVAVASNFKPTLAKIVVEFEAETEHSVLLSSASSGKLYAQIKQGAPFDLFLSADRNRPQMLIKEGFGKSGASVTYAIGRLVLWSNSSRLSIVTQGQLTDPDVKRVSIANPAFAPYGQAAVEVINSLGLSDVLSGKLVRGENINQTFQFVATRNADIGFVAYSQMLIYSQFTKEDEVGIWMIPERSYKPIRQDAVLLTDAIAAADLLAFLKSSTARKIIRESGYKTP